MAAKARTTSKTRHVKRKGGVEGLAKRRTKASAEGMRVKIGLPVGSSPYPDGTDVILVGAVQEFGSADGSIPERSWLRRAMRANRKEHSAAARKLARTVELGEGNPKEALEKLGLIAAGNVRQTIVAVASPPNKPGTVRAKGSSNPLVDTGHLVQSVTHKVVEE